MSVSPVYHLIVRFRVYYSSLLFRGPSCPLLSHRLHQLFDVYLGSPLPDLDVHPVHLLCHGAGLLVYMYRGSHFRQNTRICVYSTRRSPEHSRRIRISSNLLLPGYCKDGTRLCKGESRLHSFSRTDAHPYDHRYIHITIFDTLILSSYRSQKITSTPQPNLLTICETSMRSWRQLEPTVLQVTWWLSQTTFARMSTHTLRRSH
jgi:hypothetical protein